MMSPCDVIGLVDSTGVLVVEYKYDAWGGILGTSTLTTAYSSLASMNPFRYRGYVYDEETQLYYLQSRYYNPNWGRFISADTVLGQVGGVHSHNLYCYCGNGPVALVDPDGDEAIASTWYSTMWGLCGIDGPFPFGDIVYTIGGAAAYVLNEVGIWNIAGTLSTIDSAAMVTKEVIYNAADPTVYVKIDILEFRKRISRRSKYNTRKEAYERAKRAGKGAEPKLHTDEPYGPHYHPGLNNEYSTTPHQYCKHDHFYFPKNRFTFICFLDDYEDDDGYGDTYLWPSIK